MGKKILTLLFFVSIYFSAYSQIFPRENSNLNYRHIGFAPFTAKTPANYKIQIASGDQSTGEAFQQHIIKTVTCTTNKTIIEVPAFGSSYTWRTATSDGKAMKYGELHHFATTYSAYTDTAKTHLRLTTPALKNNGTIPCNTNIIVIVV